MGSITIQIAKRGGWSLDIPVAASSSFIAGPKFGDGGGFLSASGLWEALRVLLLISSDRLVASLREAFVRRHYRQTLG